MAGLSERRWVWQLDLLPHSLDPGAQTLAPGPCSPRAGVRVRPRRARAIKRRGPSDPNSIRRPGFFLTTCARRHRVMSLLRTSSSLRRVVLGPVPLYKPLVPATQRVDRLSHCQARTSRPPWDHQIRFSSGPPQGTGQDKDPYKVLGVPSDIPQSKIKAAYYAQAKKLHPDASKRKTNPEFHDVNRSTPRRLFSFLGGTSPADEQTLATAFRRVRQDFNS